MKTKRLMVILLISLAVPVPCWAVVGQMTKLEDEQVSMAPLLTDYVDMIQFGAQKGRERFYGLQVGGPWGLCTEEHRLCGVQIGLVNSVNRGEMCGLQVGVFNTVSNRWSCDDDVIVNGVQLGIMNFCRSGQGKCAWRVLPDRSAEHHGMQRRYVIFSAIACALVTNNLKEIGNEETNFDDVCVGRG